ncbi:MAG: type II toxin-antitoxin system VapC family toxin [Kiritimatiellales bacterium]|jgi:PIN domain nuclease of toxin-antitoxin system
MRIILDTHIFLWALAEPHRIPEKKRAEIESQSNTVYVSSISIAEIMIKASLGKLQVAFDPVEEAEKCGFEMLDFSGRDALRLGGLPFHHRDPFDRMLISQSLATRTPIMTEDSKFRLYDCRTI